MADINEFYGTRYNELLPDVLASVQREIARITGMAEALQPKARLEFLKENEREIKRFVSSSFGDLYETSIEGAYADAIDQSIDLMKVQNMTAGFGQTELEALSRLRRNQTVAFGSKSIETGNVVFKNILEWAMTGDVGSIKPFFFEASRMTTAALGRTIVDTNVSGFFRSATFQTALGAGVKRFRYAGPPAERPFCSAIHGKVFTLKEIQQLDNGQLPNTFATAGGYNCRHRWVPVAPTAKDREAVDKTDDQITNRFNSLGVTPPNKTSILVKRGGNVVGRIYRKVDPQTKTYNRVTGVKQKVKVDADGQSFIDFTTA